MAITYYNPREPQQRQFEMMMQMLMNLGMQRAQLKARKEEAETYRTWQEGQSTRQQRFIEGREARQREHESLSKAAEVGREKRAKWEEEKKAIPSTIRSQAGMLQWDAKSKGWKMLKGTGPRVPTSEAEKQKLMKERQIAVEREKARLAKGKDVVIPKGRTAEAMYWAKLLGVNLATKEGRAKVNPIMDRMYGRGDKEKKLFFDAFKAVHTDLDEVEDSMKKAQELYNKVMLSDTTKAFVQEQYPDARYDFAGGYWYVMKNGKKYRIEITQ